MRIREWLIKKLIGNTPVIMNVTLKLDDEIMASSPNGIIDRCNISYTKRLLGGEKHGKA